MLACRLLVLAWAVLQHSMDAPASPLRAERGIYNHRWSLQRRLGAYVRPLWARKGFQERRWSLQREWASLAGGYKPTRCKPRCCKPSKAAFKESLQQVELPAGTLKAALADSTRCCNAAGPSWPPGRVEAQEEHSKYGAAVSERAAGTGPPESGPAVEPVSIWIAMLQPA